MIPGANLLRQALGVIGAQEIFYFRNTGRVLDAAGVDVAAYAAGVRIPGCSVQPVSRARYVQMGLDFSRNYIAVFAPVSASGIRRNSSGDRIMYRGDYYEIESDTPWFALDGWVELLCVWVMPGSTSGVET